MRKRTAPPRGAHLRRRDQVMAKPVSAPATEATALGTTRRRPESVAEERRTAWKYRGLHRQGSATECPLPRSKAETTASSQNNTVVGGKGQISLKTYLLKRIAFINMAAMKLEKTRFALGALVSSDRGMMGFLAFFSTYTRAGEATAKMTREAMTKGCDPVHQKSSLAGTHEVS